MSLLHKKIMFLSAQKFFSDFFFVSDQKTSSDRLFLFFQINQSYSTQWRLLMSDINFINKKRNVVISFLQIKKEVLSVKQFFHLMEKNNSQQKQYLRFLLNGPCLVVSLNGLNNSPDFSFFSKMIKRLEKENKFVLVGGIWNNKFFHSKEILTLFSNISLTGVWSNFVNTLTYHHQKLLLLLNCQKNQKNL